MRNFVITLLTCSVTTSAIGLLYLALTPALARRYSEKWSYYAWLIIIVGLLIPFRPHFAGAIDRYDVPERVPYVTSGAIMTSVQHGVAASSTTPAAASNISIWHVAFMIWLAGVAVFVILHAVRHQRFLKMTTRWSNCTDCDHETAMLERLKAEMNIKKEIGLYRCPSVGSPMLLGMLKPRILLPQTPISMDEMGFILRHELIHFKRGDIWFKCAALLAAAVHWFNPIVYLLAKAIDAACELSCDAETMRNADMDARQRYSETIIGVVRCQSRLKTVLSTNFYGGKSGMKKRIYSIMDSGRKKPGIAILCGMLILTMATGMAFAASTSESKGPTLEQHDRLPNAQAVSEASDSMMSRFDPETGKTFYSWDLGKTWTPLTSEEYAVMFPSPVVEWWTYEEYQIWKDEQIRSLQALADDGISDYYDKNGVLRDFTQADVDEMAALYQSILENIKSGYRVSKTVDGLTGVAMSYNPQDIMLGVEETYAVASASDTDAEYDYSKYIPYGLTYDKAARRLHYKGELVRYFEDSYPLGEKMASYVTHFDRNGTIDVHAVRDLSRIVHNPDGSFDPSGVLVGVEPYSQAEFDARDVSQYTYDNTFTQIAMAESIEEDLRPYKTFGVSYDSRAGMMMYDGVPVREIHDPHLGMLIALSGGTGFSSGIVPDGAIDLIAIYENGILTGLRKSTRDEFEARTQNRLATSSAVTVIQDTAETYQSSIASEAYIGTFGGAASDASSSGNAYSATSTLVYDNAAVVTETEGQTFEQMFERYRAHGIIYSPASVNGGLGNIYYNGELVKSFVDINPSGGVMSCSSSDGGEITVRTVYNNDGDLTGMEVTEAQK